MFRVQGKSTAGMMALTCLQVWTEGLEVGGARDRPWHRSEARGNRNGALRAPDCERGTADSG